MKLSELKDKEGKAAWPQVKIKTNTMVLRDDVVRLLGRKRLTVDVEALAQELFFIIKRRTPLSCGWDRQQMKEMMCKAHELAGRLQEFIRLDKGEE